MVKSRVMEICYGGDCSRDFDTRAANPADYSFRMPAAPLYSPVSPSAAEHGFPDARLRNELRANPTVRA
jgi:hypothetical protein